MLLFIIKVLLYGSYFKRKKRIRHPLNGPIQDMNPNIMYGFNLLISYIDMHGDDF